MTDIKNRKSVIKAILVLNSNAKVVVRGDDNLDTCEIEWLDGTTPITKEDIKVEWDKLWLILVAKMESVLVVNEYRTVVKKHTYSSGCS